jgi:hypothetical protein
MYILPLHVISLSFSLEHTHSQTLNSKKLEKKLNTMFKFRERRISFCITSCEVFQNRSFEAQLMNFKISNSTFQSLENFKVLQVFS